LGAIRTGLICGVVTLVTVIIVLNFARYIPVFCNWPQNTLISGYAARALVVLSLLLVFHEIAVTRHPFYEIWLLAAVGAIVGVAAW
jgi:hypothetical protein